MTSRARIFDLYARREAAQVAGLGRAVSRAVSARAEAEATCARLRQIAQEIQMTSGPTIAANLRDRGMLASGLVEEAARQDEKAALAGAEAARLRQTMNFHDRRCQFGETAAANARIAEAEAAEARAEAARPVPRRG
jgi:hypothetical protein